MRKYSKFLLDVEDGSGGYGGELEVVSAPVEGSLEEYEFVKLRNHVDDDDETVEALEDLITLSYLHEPSILCCLKKRFERNLIYTNTGPILIAVVSAFHTDHIHNSNLFFRTLSRICPYTRKRVLRFTETQGRWQSSTRTL